MAAFHAFTRSANAEAVAHFSRASELEPGFAAAWGMAARCYAQRRGFGWVVDHDEERAESRRLARIATTLGRDDAIALAASGFALVMAGEVADGDAFLDQALAVNPNLAWAWHISGFSKAITGQHDAAVEHAARAMRLSPQDPQFFAMRAVVALRHYLAGRYEAAYPWAQAALREKSNFLLAAGTTAACAARLGRPDDAARAMARMREIGPDLRLANLGDWIAFQRPEDAGRWAEGLGKAGLPE